MSNKNENVIQDVTTGKIKTLLIGLDEWRAERRLAPETQTIGYFRNISEELAELSDAFCNKEIEEQIDAICDIFVFSGNLLASSHFRPSIKNFNVVSQVVNKKPGGFFQKLSRAYGIYYDYVVAGDYDMASGALLYIYVSHQNFLDRLGYDFFLAMQEVIKVISSRTGSWNEEVGKWIKDPIQNNLYEANFHNAKIN